MSGEVGGGTARMRAAVLTLALIVTQAVYALVAWIIVGDGWEPPLGSTVAAALGPTAVALAAGLLLMSWVLQARLADTGGAAEAARRRFAAWLAGQAMRESVGVLGLVLTLLTGEILWVAVMAAVATAALLVGWFGQRSPRSIDRTGSGDR